MDTTILRKEDKIYSSLWQNGYKDANWKRLAKAVLHMAEQYTKKPTIIDFGFGKGSALDFFESKGLHVEGMDISSYAVKEQLAKGRNAYHTSLDDLAMLKDNQFNIGFCNDVIEHVPEELVDDSLEEMSRVCSDYLFISVCPTASHHLSREGENLHLTVQPESWWTEKLSQYGETEMLKFRFSRSIRYIVHLQPKLIK